MDLKALETIAGEQLKKYKLHQWTFCFGNTKRRLGACKYRTKQIEISEYYASHSPEATVIDTLLHEIAHAIAGPSAGHGPRWKAVAVLVGATPLACESSGDLVIRPGDWQATCPVCKETYHRYRRPTSLQGYQCRCRARATITFEYKGDPSRKPDIPLTMEESAKWEALCVGCGVLHLRTRKPQAGVWQCKCPDGCKLTWKLRSPSNMPRA